MINKFDSVTLKKVMDKILLVFVFYLVAAASFNGFFAKWAFLDISIYEQSNSFKYIFAGTAHRPFVYRQLMIDISKGIKKLIPKDEREELTKSLQEHDFIPEYYAKAKIDPSCLIEYHIVYFLAFFFLLISMFIWRQLLSEITGSTIAGTLTACCFALIFPILETVGGYFYDFGELLFFSSAVFFAHRGWWLPLILITPFAEYNKESFFFFVVTLFPLLMAKIGKKKAASVIALCVLISGCVYLYISSVYADNIGVPAEFQLHFHLQLLFNLWTYTEIVYGVFFGWGTFFLYVILVAWLMKSAWSKLSLTWKYHLGLAALINIPLYLLFCAPGELRNLSMLFISFMVSLAVYLNEVIISVQRRQ